MTGVARVLAIMGSGETAPTMIKPHRQIFERLGDPPVPAVLLDTPYGFQANADDISARAADYFATSVGRRVDVAELRRSDGDPVARTAALAQVASARWVFAGPGSPSYALRQWRDTEMPSLLADKLEHGGAVVFASAAALTLGRWTVPVYEVYKVGAEPEWLEGLDLLGFLGPEVAVIPHYDNAEGGHHDTRFCYLGEPRLARLEAQMGPDGWVLGVDEHTGCIFDLEAGTATVVGNGVVTVRRQGRSATVKSGEVLGIAALVDLATGRAAGSTDRAGGAGADGPAGGGGGPSGRRAAPGGRGAPGTSDPAAPTALHSEIRRLEEEFDAAVSRSDVDGAVRAVLELDDTLVAWSGDTTQSDAGTRGRAAMRRMVARLGELARTGARDPREVVGGFVTALLEERAAARADRRFGDADRIRDALTDCAVEVRDTPDGTVWDLRSPET
jgi:cyanophycinase-like exopeptidase